MPTFMARSYGSIGLYRVILPLQNAEAIRWVSGARAQPGGEENFPKNEASPWLRKEVNLRQALALLRGGFVLGIQIRSDSFWDGGFCHRKTHGSRQGGFFCAFLLGFNMISLYISDE